MTNITADNGTRSFTTNGGRTYEINSEKVNKATLDKLSALSNEGLLDNSDVINILRSFPSSYRIVAGPGMPPQGDGKLEEPPFDSMNLDMTSFYLSQMETNRKLEFALRNQARQEQRDRLKFETDERDTAKKAAEKHYQSAIIAAGTSMGSTVFTFAGAAGSIKSLRNASKAAKAENAANKASAPLKDLQAEGPKGLQNQLDGIDVRRANSVAAKEKAQRAQAADDDVPTLQAQRARVEARIGTRSEKVTDQARLDDLDLRIAQQQHRATVIKHQEAQGPKLDAEARAAQDGFEGRTREIQRHDEIAGTSRRDHEHHVNVSRSTMPVASAFQTIGTEGGKTVAAGETLDGQLTDADAKFDGALAAQEGMSMQISQEGYNALSSANNDLAAAIRSQTEQQHSFGSKTTSF